MRDLRTSRTHQHSYFLEAITAYKIEHSLNSYILLFLVARLQQGVFVLSFNPPKHDTTWKQFNGHSAWSTTHERVFNTSERW